MLTPGFRGDKDRGNRPHRCSPSTDDRRFSYDSYILDDNGGSFSMTQFAMLPPLYATTKKSPVPVSQSPCFDIDLFPTILLILY